MPSKALKSPFHEMFLQQIQQLPGDSVRLDFAQAFPSSGFEMSPMVEQSLVEFFNAAVFCRHGLDHLRHPAGTLEAIRGCVDHEAEIPDRSWGALPVRLVYDKKVADFHEPSFDSLDVVAHARDV